MTIFVRLTLTSDPRKTGDDFLSFVGPELGSDDNEEREDNIL